MAIVAERFTKRFATIALCVSSRSQPIICLLVVHPVKEHHNLRAGMLFIGRKAPLPHAVGHARADRPADGLGVLRALCCIEKRRSVGREHPLRVERTSAIHDLRCIQQCRADLIHRPLWVPCPQLRRRAAHDRCGEARPLRRAPSTG